MNTRNFSSVVCLEIRQNLGFPGRSKAPYITNSSWETLFAFDNEGLVNELHVTKGGQFRISDPELSESQTSNIYLSSVLPCLRYCATCYVVLESRQLMMKISRRGNLPLQPIVANHLFRLSFRRGCTLSCELI